MKATIRLSAGNVIAPVDKRIFSSFIEHMGRAVYTGIYEPGHPSADASGFRTDVMDLVRPLGLSHIRYPGGNFLSGYRWKDGIGPKESRPVRPELAWLAIEPNQVGTDEFLTWCERLGISPMLGVNLGTGTPQDAVDLLEYVNGGLSTHYAQMRRENGREKPYGVKLWCLGNEMDGPWQICAKTAEEYGRVACETAKMMKLLDPDIELVVCGSSGRDMPTFGQWERTVLKHCYPYADYLSLHQYFSNEDGDVPSFLARSLQAEDFIRTAAGFCAEAKREQKGERDIYLSFDEWNVWYHFRMSGREPEKWIVARPIEEERYDEVDALVVACMLNTLLRNADTVKIACLAQLVNVIAPIMTEPDGRSWAQSIYYPFLYASKYGRGISLRPEVTAPEYACAAGSHIPYLDCSAVQNPNGTVSVFAVNRSETDAIELDCALSGFGETAEAERITGTERHALNANQTVLPPLSWSVLRFHPVSA